MFGTPHFQDHQRAYNGLFAMAAFGASVNKNMPDQRTWTQPRPPSALTLHGSGYLRIFDPTEAYASELCRVRNYSRLYMHDGFNEGGHVAEARRYNDQKAKETNKERKKTTETLNITFVENLRKAVLEKNSWAHTYFSVMKDICAQNEDEVGEGVILFAPTNRKEDGPIVGDTPQAQEIAALLFQDGPTSKRATYVYPKRKPRDGDAAPPRPRFLNILEKCYETLAYPLLFFHGDAGWGVDLETKKRNKENNENNEERNNSMFFYARQLIMCNPVFTLLPRVMQEWACNIISRHEEIVLTYLQQPKLQKRIATYSKVINTEKGESGKKEIQVGKKLPATHPGHPAKLRKLQQEALAVVYRRGKPHFFLTMTCNTNWPEIRENLLPSQTAQDRVDLNHRVFKMKLAQLMAELRSGKIFGEMDYEMYVRPGLNYTPKSQKSAIGTFSTRK
jgi:hypothetical protein